MPKSKILEITQRHEGVRSAIRRVLKTNDGKVLYRYLSDTFYDCQLKPDRLERQAGSRDVVWNLKNILKEQDNE